MLGLMDQTCVHVSVKGVVVPRYDQLDVNPRYDLVGLALSR